MMEESIQQILEDSLMCDTSFDDLILPGLESFGLIIPESSNNIESNNVEEGSNEDLKTLAGKYMNYIICPKIENKKKHSFKHVTYNILRISSFTS
ncbi:U90 [Human betaherpesvirus 6A]|uniref:U90 n=3 Tax=Human betaherpesvirus 6A TaxID=32603 RepID=W8FQV6_9BETA|nr:U90 [Human betaherpesvirus 6A]